MIEDGPILEDEHDTSFAERLSKLLIDNGLTQDELAGRIGCTRLAISMMLTRNARPQSSMIIKMAEALDVPTTELWPHTETAAILDVVSDFLDDQVLTPEQANALDAASEQSPATAKARELPSRRRT